MLPRYHGFSDSGLSISKFFRILKVPTLFFGAFLAHMAVRPVAHCYQTDAIYTTVQSNVAQHSADPQNKHLAAPY